ncbi:hypothetical protein GCM10022243_65930 [Saccharothrix violaceirubra]|uniref:DUF4244 domain-containing protein n=1 Tax=Saccharothrix violaceirubra TaxID=413306 RepID=A0A7W7T9J6_9PSEU|nr:DUF4244 domain-containing protein [Saccharothrix violaceirubra]MBB4968921.1 hypothetical protein [Saccharothrix violaceirubra]
MDDRGMTTAEYAVGTLAAAALGGVLFALLGGDWIGGLLRALLQEAFSTVT